MKTKRSQRKRLANAIATSKNHYTIIYKIKQISVKLINIVFF